MPQVRGIVMEALERAVAGGKDPAEALDEGAAQRTKQLQDYNSRVGE